MTLNSIAKWLLFPYKTEGMWKDLSACLISSRASLDCSGKRGQACILLGCLFLTLVGGCKQSGSADKTPSQNSEQTTQAFTNVARIHWLGKKRISAETNAAGFMQIWNLPQSARLEMQTLDKLALALVITNRAPLTNYQAPPTNYSALLKGPSAYLRPLLDDLLQEESYWEFGSSPEASQLAFAVKLHQSRAFLWQSNLLAAAKAWVGSKVSPDGKGWQIELSAPPSMVDFFVASNSLAEDLISRKIHIELQRSADWTLVGIGPKTNGLLGNLRRRIERHQAPFQSRATNFWFEAENINLNQMQRLVGLRLTQELPTVSFTMIGDGENVRTRGQLNFSKPLALELEPWTIPTNLISAPLVSFSAIRGFRPWLSALKTWTDLQPRTPPNQLYLWAIDSIPIGTYFAVPHREASNLVARISDLVLQKGRAFFATNDVARFEKAQTYNGLQWRGLPALSPFIKSFQTNGQSFVLGGTFILDQAHLPPPAELVQQVLAGPTNLIAYDWELTGPRKEQLNYIAPFIRFASYKEQMTDAQASRALIDAASASLGNCGTIFTLSSPNQISFSRRSSCGFTAIELDLLADWLESPNFPQGLRSFIPAPRVIGSPLPPGPGR
jgi:hypothetical protein